MHANQSPDTRLCLRGNDNDHMHLAQTDEHHLVNQSIGNGLDYTRSEKNPSSSTRSPCPDKTSKTCYST